LFKWRFPILNQVDAMRDLLDDQMEEMHGLFVAHFQKNKRMPETQKLSHCDQS
jgi:hypothetical protein